MQLGVSLALKPLQWYRHYRLFLTQMAHLDLQYPKQVQLQEPPLTFQSFAVRPPPQLISFDFDCNRSIIKIEILA